MEGPWTAIKEPFGGHSDWTQTCQAVLIPAAAIGILWTSHGEVKGIFVVLDGLKDKGAWKLHGRRLKLS